MSAFLDIPKEFLTFEVLIWILPCVLVSIMIGAVIGRGLALRNMTKRLRTEKTQLIKALQTLLKSTEELSTGVDSHNNELATVQECVTHLNAEGDLDIVQQALLQQIEAVVSANRQMEDDLVVTRYQLQEQAQELDKSRHEACTDQLSGLGNRKLFDESIQFAISQFKRKDVPFALVLADVDHFKRINDTHGHQAGDNVVRRIGETLKQLCRGHDYISRYGGDEFAILLMKASEENARRAAARIRSAIERTNFDVGANGSRVAVTFSMGMAFPRTTDTTEALFDRADRALYESKKRGRNQLHVYAEPAARHQDTDPTAEPQLADAGSAVDHHVPAQHVALR